VIPTHGCHRCVRRELLLCEISGGRPTSSRTGWVPNLTDDTPDDRLSRIEPDQDAQADRVPINTGDGTLSREVPLGLLGRAALADEGSDGLVDDRRLGKACRGAPFGRTWQVLIEDEVTQGPGGEPRKVRGEVDKRSRRPRVQDDDHHWEKTDITDTWQRQPQRGADITRPDTLPSWGEVGWPV
jgi:hypothetical protein